MKHPSSTSSSKDEVDRRALGEGRTVIWRQGEIIDALPRLRHPWGAVFAVLSLVLLADLLLAIALKTGERREDLEFNHARGVRAYLARTVREAQSDKPVWLLIGDSVLQGDSIRQEVPDWHRHRVVDYLDAEQALEKPARFRQLALNGLLPVDMLQLVRELDRQDPAARVHLALEVNLRYFSRYYVEQDACTRPWLEELAPPLLREGGIDWRALFSFQARLLSETIHDVLPILRHRDVLPNPIAGNRLAQWVIGAAPVPVEDPLAVQARMREHFQTPVLVGDFAQLRALDEIVERLRRSGRRALFFTPPLRDADLDAISTPQRYGEDLALLSARTESEASPSVSMVHFDHPLFHDALFKDIAHLFPEGNRLLALNLLQAMNVPLARLPAPAECVYPEGPDSTLVWNVQPGCNDGLPWQAAFRDPAGIALHGQRIVVADTGNHCLREIAGHRPIVRRLAGIAGQSGHRDGPALEALLDRPTSLCSMGDALFFADGGGQYLRRLDKGLVLTDYPLDGPAWSEIRTLRRRGQRLYIDDAGQRILVYDPLIAQTKTAVTGGLFGGIRAFDLSPDGRIFIADTSNRIWVGDPLSLLPEEGQVTLLFPNGGPAAIPAEGYYPFHFSAIRFDEIVDLRYVSRYDGLLVQDRLALKRDVPGLDERIHLSMIGLRERLVYPWVKPSVSGDYIAWNEAAESYVTPMREGVLAFEPQSNTLYHLERNRTRLLRLSDGLWGAAKIGQVGYRPEGTVHPDLFSYVTGPYIFQNLEPQRYLAERIEDLPRNGPYFGLILGPSTVSASDMALLYSLGRATETRLQRRLGLCDGLRLDLAVRSRGGLNFEEAIELFETFVALDGRADVLLIAVRDALTRLTEAEAADWIERLGEAAARYDTLVLFFEGHGLFGMNRDGLRPTSETIEGTKALLRSAGFHVIDFTNTWLRESLEVSPATSPPFARHHAAPWAIDLAAELLAERAYPFLRAHLRDRVPALRMFPRFEEETEVRLRTLFDAYNLDWAALDLPPVDLGAIQMRYDKRQLEILADLGKSGVYSADDPPEKLEDIALSVLVAALRQDMAGRLATRAILSLAVFSNYDEYGEGVRETARILYSLSLDAHDLLVFLDRRFPEARHSAATAAETREALPGIETEDMQPMGIME
jgi:hypothetical protein